MVTERPLSALWIYAKPTIQTTTTCTRRARGRVRHDGILLGRDVHLYRARR